MSKIKKSESTGETKARMIEVITRVINEAVDAEVTIDIGADEKVEEGFVRQQPNGIKIITVTAYPFKREKIQ